MIDRLGQRWMTMLGEWLPWTNVYGLARSLIALGTLLTLLFNSTDVLFREVTGSSGRITCVGGMGWSLFCQVPLAQLEVARWCCVLALLSVISGYRPRWTGLLHWYVSFSLFSTARLGDGGDQVAAVLSLFLIPIALSDPRRWVWQPPVTLNGRTSWLRWLGAVAVVSVWLAMMLQLAVIYFHAGTGKMQVPEWANGTAMYYWLNSPYMGLPEPLRSWAQPLLTSPLVALLTWSVMVLEVTLFASLFMNRNWRRPLLVVALFFHIGIAVFMGITSFSVTMLGAVVLLLRRPYEVFALPWVVFLTLGARRSTVHPTVALVSPPASYGPSIVQQEVS